MKRLYFLIITLLAFISSFGQPQQTGIIKSIGRPDKPGVPIPNASIKVRGLVNSAISTDNGEFHIYIPELMDGDEFFLVSVRKNGYELKDKDIIGRPLVYSTKVPLELLMVDVEQLMKDRARIEENAYRAADKRYKDRVDELENQVKENKITEDKYHAALMELQTNYERYLSLISDMADRYARTDYDDLNETEKQIMDCIEEGELLKADSLIHTIFDPNTVVEKNRAAKEEIRHNRELALEFINKASSDRDSILKDIDKAKEIDETCRNLSGEYLIRGDTLRACNCLEKALEIEKILYGEYDFRVRDTEKALNELRR